MDNKKITINEAWNNIIDKFNIIDRVNKDGEFYISANDIREYKEPRLMAKWDCSSSLPPALKDNKLNILPVSRYSYVLGKFVLYEPIPELIESVNKMDYVEMPQYETIDINNISSEANAINILNLSGILNDFLGEKNTVETFNGRMSTSDFEFKVNTIYNSKHNIKVSKAQCEIDGGFENENSVVIMEAKNIINEDFHVRQLYYPYRTWKERVAKPIRLVFSIYSNMIFRLFEYSFSDINDYSSIQLVNSKNYSLQNTTIEVEDLINIRNNTKVIFQDNQNADLKVPFIQANSFEKVVSLLENIKDNPLTTEQVARFMNFDERQSDYYYNAGAYLGLFIKKHEYNQTKIYLTDLGEDVFSLNYKQRQLKFVKLILQHQIFADCFDLVLDRNGEMPNKEKVEELMRKYNVCNEAQISRRSSTVLGWLKWLFNLKNL